MEEFGSVLIPYILYYVLFADNDIDIKGCMAIAEALEVNSTLLSLNLRGVSTDLKTLAYGLECPTCYEGFFDNKKACKCTN